MADKIIMILDILKTNEQHDVEVPLDISADDLVVALTNAYGLNINLDDIGQRYVKTENPIRLLKGRKLLKDYDLKNGTRIIITR